MRTYFYNLLTNGSIAANSPLSGNIASSAQHIEYTYAYSIQATYTGAFPQGILSLFASNDGINFVTVKGSSVQIMEGSSGTTIWNTQFSNYDWVKVGFQATSASSGVLNASIYSKGG